MTATRKADCTTVLYVAFELGWNEWKLGFTTSPAEPVRQRTVRARDLLSLTNEFAKAKQRFGLAAEAPVRSCYEARRLLAAPLPDPAGPGECHRRVREH